MGALAKAHLNDRLLHGEIGDGEGAQRWFVSDERNSSLRQAYEQRAVGEA